MRFWNKRDAEDIEPWELEDKYTKYIEPQNNGNRLHFDRGLYALMAFVVLFLATCLLSRSASPETNDGGTKDRMADPACQKTSVGGGANITASMFGTTEIRTYSKDKHTIARPVMASMTRENDDQYAGLLHFEDENGNKLLDDVWVFFDPDCYVDVTFPAISNMKTSTKGIQSFYPFECTVKYYADSKYKKVFPGKTYTLWGYEVSMDGIQPDGYTFEVPSCDIPEHEGKCLLSHDGTIHHYQSPLSIDTTVTSTAPENDAGALEIPDIDTIDIDTLRALGNKPTLEMLRNHGIDHVCYEIDSAQSPYTHIKWVDLDDTLLHRVTDKDLSPAQTLCTNLTLSESYIAYNGNLYIVTDESITPVT